jgi:hypothetical protein
MSDVLIYIGGIWNGDYAGFQKQFLSRKPTRDGYYRWASHKDAKVGDRVLVYMQRPVSALIASGIVTSLKKDALPGDLAAYKTDLDDAYRYRAPLRQFRMLPKYKSLDELRREFPEWKWIDRPQGKINMTKHYPEFAEKLWAWARGR